jgi:hypothetical protein
MRPDLDSPLWGGREAKCFCGAVRPSRPTQLAHLEYRGLYSDHSLACRVCGKTHLAHLPWHPLTGEPNNVDHEYVANGVQEYDAFYCGCRDEETL